MSGFLLDGGGPAGSRYHCGDDLHLRARRRGRALNLEDYFPQKKRWWLPLQEKNGKINEMPCHHKLNTYLDAHIEAAAIGSEPKGPLFRAAIGKTKNLRPWMSRIDVWYDSPPPRFRRGH